MNTKITLLSLLATAAALVAAAPAAPSMNQVGHTVGALPKPGSQHKKPAPHTAVQTPAPRGLRRTRIVPKVANKTFKTVSPKDTPASFAKQTPEQKATAFVTQKLGIPASDFIIKDVVPLTGGGHAVHLRQKINGIEVHNAAINVNIDKTGKIISYGDHFYRGPRPAAPPVFGGAPHRGGATTASTHLPAPAGVKLSPVDGFHQLAKAIGLPLDGKKVAAKETTHPSPQAAKTFHVETDAALSPVPAHFEYVQDGSSLHLTYTYRVELTDNWFEGHVNAQTGQVVKVTDWVADASYYVIPFGKVDPTDGGLKTVTTTGEPNASPKGWHDDGSQQYTDTRGNNVLAQENIQNNDDSVSTGRRPDGGANLVFDNKPDFSQEPSSYTDAVTQQLFYTINMMHDLSYQYGFDEPSGNFQASNLGKGGVEGDPVIGNAQDGSGTNNANFATPPDGQSGKMRMYVFTETTPGRDGTYDQGVPYHEFTHGISSRLTGGQHDGSCLDTLTAGGMGEGWSDTVAWTILAKPTDTRDTDVVMGAYVVNKKAGIRTHPYSTSLQRNPTKFSAHNAQDYQEVHMLGEIWSNTLFEVYWNLVDKLGFSSDLMHDAKSGKGNTVFLQILLDGMKLQPCSPNFISARDAIIQAEQNLTNGANHCELWKGFAKRGLGTDAQWDDQNGATDGFSLPQECQ